MQSLAHCLKPQHVEGIGPDTVALFLIVAYRVLGNHEEAVEAVQNCLRTAADNVPRLEHEGAFRGWLARVLIDEAVLLLSKQSVAPPHTEQPEPSRLTGAFSSEVRRISGRGADL